NVALKDNVQGSFLDAKPECPGAAAANDVLLAIALHRDGDAAHNRPEAAPFRFNRGDADARDGAALRVHHLSGEDDAARNRDHDAALLFAWVESHRSAVRCRESFLRGFDLHFRFRKDIAEDETAMRSAESSCV